MRCSLMGGSHYPLSTRQAAVEAWIQAGSPAVGQRTEALRLFRGRVPADALPHNPSEFMDQHVRSWVERGSVADKSPEPRQSLIDDATAKECVKQLLAGYADGDRHRYYRSLREASKKNAYIKNVFATHLDPITARPLTTCTLWRRLKAVSPTLTRRTLRYAFKLTAAHKAARVAYCRKLLGMSKEERERFLARVVWIDSKKLYVVPKAHLVYAPPGANLLIQDPRLSSKSYTCKKIYYYAAVNAALGGTYFFPATGTSPDKVDGKYLYPAGTACYKVGGCWPAS